VPTEHQSDFICTDCPLLFCDEESLWCAFRWATNPNQAQLKVASVRIIPQRLTDAERGRKYRTRNPEKRAETVRKYRANMPKEKRDAINLKRRLKRKQDLAK